MAGWQWLDPAPGNERWSAWETGALLLWFAVAGFALAQHVPWADEAQAWLLASGLGWKALFVHGLRYEGEGGLWHAFLKLLHGLHISFWVVRWVALAAQGAAMALLLRWAPFPRAIRLLLPFTFFLLYQDAVVTRSYCLFALLAFSAAVVLRGTRPRPLALAFLLGPMAMLTMHAAVLSGGLVIVALVHWRGIASRGRMVAAAGVVLVFYAGTALVMAPPRDVDFSAGNNLHRSLAKTERSLGMHPSPPPPAIGTLGMAGLAPTPEVHHIRHGGARAWYRISRIGGVITYPLASSKLLALLLVIAVFVQAWFVRTQRGERESIGAVGLVPYLLMLLVFSSLYLQPRHSGTLLTGFLVAAWLTWPARSGLAGRRLALTRTTAALLFAVAVMQITWSAHAINKERTLPYAPGRMTAEFLRSQGISATGDTRPIAGYYYYTMGPLLYFNRNIYFNQPPHRYWLWSTSMRTYSTVQQVLARRPSIIVVGGVEAGPDTAITRDWEANTPPVPGVVLGDGFHIMQYFEQHGYRATHVFCGHRWMRATWAEEQCDTILQPSQNNPSQ